MLHSNHVKDKLYGWCINYQYTTTGSRATRNMYGDVACQGGEHVIEMILDLNAYAYTLRYIHNGNDQGIAYDDIEQTAYRVVWGATKQADKIEILDYTHSP